MFHSHHKPTKPSVERRLMLEMLASISSMRMHTFMRNNATRRKLCVNELLYELDTKKSIHEFLMASENELLNLLNAHALIIYQNSNETEKLVYGDHSIIPNALGFKILSERCKMNSSYSITNIEEGLEGNGAGVIFFKNHHIMIACIRRNLYSDIKWLVGVAVLA